MIDQVSILNIIEYHRENKIEKYKKKDSNHFH